MSPNMDRPKNSVIKSKSSNSAITTKSEPRKNKKSRSNAEIQPLLLKKRGVYVENKGTKLSGKPQGPPSRASSTKDSNNIPAKPVKPPPIPRPDRKRFLNSVLAILSKSTAGTQYPDNDDRTNISKSNRRCERIQFKTKLDPEDDHFVTDVAYTAKKKHKYRSRILNDHKNDVDNVITLQSKKDIVHTPSINSHVSSLKEQKTKEEIQKSIYDNNDTIAKHVLDGIKLKEKKVKQNDTPKKDDKGLYNFFVDLLETTFSIYNVKPEYGGLPNNSITSSKIALEIDESVAKKLNFEEMSDDVTQKPSKNFCCVPENDWFEQDLLEYVQTQNKSYSKRSKCSPKTSKRFNSRSFHYTRPQSPLPAAKSFTANKKSIKKTMKKEVIESIKEQLRMDTYTYEEPQNLFQALKIMASNKRKCRKSIHFEREAASKNKECVFKRRQVISFSTKSSGKESMNPKSDVYRSMINNYSENSSTIKNNMKSEITIPESEHSLEVYGFDYESMADRNDVNQLKDIELMYHSSPTQSAQDFNINEALLKYSESGTSSIQNYINWNHGITSVTKVMKKI